MATAAACRSILSCAALAPECSVLDVGVGGKQRKNKGTAALKGFADGPMDGESYGEYCKSCMTLTVVTPFALTPCMSCAQG